MQERAEHIAEWIKLTEEKQRQEKGEGISAQVAPKIAKDGSSRGRPEGGINQAVRELGIERTEAQRAVKIAELSPEAKQAAKETGMDDKQTVLLKAARAPSVDQEGVIREHRFRLLRQSGKVTMWEIAPKGLLDGQVCGAASNRLPASHYRSRLPQRTGHRAELAE